jgi:nucleotide-binding universal stress UspA family protein
MKEVKILIPTDFSVQAEYAYLMVKKMQEKMNAQIHFLHVLSVPETVSMGADGSIQTCGEIDVRYVEQQKSIAERKLANLNTLYGSDIQTHLVLGKVTDAIVQFASANEYDLVVMGTKGAWGLKEKISGTETQMVARRSTVPVLRLMCDRSELDFGVQIHFLQIVSGSVNDKREAVENNMKVFAQLNKISSYQSHIVSDSDVENGVVHFNQMQDMDMICIGTHGKGGFFHHSATEKLINHLFKPIISFHLQSAK